MGAFPGKKMVRYTAILFALSSLMAFPASGNAFEAHGKASAPVTDENPFLFPIHFFRKYISGADGDRCAMYPSCSRYALDAVEKHGVITGWIMTCDRLMRCGRDEVKHVPAVSVGHRFLAYDPVANNDFWWESK